MKKEMMVIITLVAILSLAAVYPPIETPSIRVGNNVQINSNGIQSLDQTLGLSGLPVTTLTYICPGYFTDSNNGGYTNILGTSNTVAGINSAINKYGWYVADGSCITVPGSPIFGVAGRCLPNAMNSFIMGAANAGGMTTNGATFTGNSVTSSSSLGSGYGVSTGGTINVSGGASVSGNVNVGGQVSVSGSVPLLAHNHGTAGIRNGSMYAAIAFPIARPGGSNGFYDELVSEGVAQFSPTMMSWGYDNNMTQVSQVGTSVKGVTATNNPGTPASITLESGMFYMSGSNTLGGTSSGAGYNTMYGSVTDSLAHNHSTTATGSITNVMPTALKCFPIFKVK